MNESRKATMNITFLQDTAKADKIIYNVVRSLPAEGSREQLLTVTIQFTLREYSSEPKLSVGRSNRDLRFLKTVKLVLG